MIKPAFFFTLLLSFFCIVASNYAADTSVTSAPIKVACVGDSITAGAGAPKGKSYPAQLQSLLGPGWKVQNFGRSGRTMLRKGDNSYWKEKNLQKAEDFKPNVVIIMLGTNDSKPRNWVHENEFITDYRDMVKLFQALDTKPRIYLCHVPTVIEPNKYKISETNSIIIRQRIDDLAKEMNLEVIPMDKAYGNDLSVLKDKDDNVHPNAQGALELAQTAAKALTASGATQPIHAAN